MEIYRCDSEYDTCFTRVGILRTHLIRIARKHVLISYTHIKFVSIPLSLYLLT